MYPIYLQKSKMSFSNQCSASLDRHNEIYRRAPHRRSLTAIGLG